MFKQPKSKIKGTIHFIPCSQWIGQSVLKEIYVEKNSYNEASEVLE